MFGQQVGKIEQPLDNIVIEEARRLDGTREVYITISMRDLPTTRPIAEKVAGYAASNPELGQIFVDSLEHSFGFSRDFGDYMREAKSKKVGEMQPIKYKFLKFHLLLASGLTDGRKDPEWLTVQYAISCIGTNVFAKLADDTEIWYILNGHGIIEDSFSIAQNKGFEHPNRDLARQGVIGYLLLGNDRLLDETKKTIVSVVSEQPSASRGILTWNDVAYMKEALSEFRFQAYRAREGTKNTWN